MSRNDKDDERFDGIRVERNYNNWETEFKDLHKKT